MQSISRLDLDTLIHITKLRKESARYRSELRAAQAQIPELTRQIDQLTSDLADTKLWDREVRSALRESLRAADRRIVELEEELVELKAAQRGAE